MKSQKGFTLIELLLVLAIIGIISAIAVPAILGQREAAKNRNVEAAADNIRGVVANALDAIQLEKAQRPTDLTSATTIKDVLTALAARNDIKAAMNPFDATVAIYTFNAANTSTIGGVGVVGLADSVTGANTVAITYVLSAKGVAAPKTGKPVEASGIPLT